MRREFKFQVIGEIWTPSRRGRVAIMQMQNWEELWRVAKEIKRARIKPPTCHNYYWAGPSKTQQERERSAIISAATNVLRTALEASDDTRNLADSLDPCYKSASIFVSSKAWVKLDCNDCNVFFFLHEKIPANLHQKLEFVGREMEKAMSERTR